MKACVAAVLLLAGCKARDRVDPGAEALSIAEAHSERLDALESQVADLKQEQAELKDSLRLREANEATIFRSHDELVDKHNQVNRRLVDVENRLGM